MGNTKSEEQTSKNDTIIINGRPVTYGEKEITFRKVVELAFGKFDENPLICYTVTYTRGDTPKPQGSLVDNESVNTKREMIFNVTRTDKS